MAFYTDYLAATLMFNLQILPDSLISGLVILAVVLANQAIMALAAGAIGTQLLTGAVGRLIMQMLPGAAERTSSMDMCTAGFIGKFWERLSNIPENLWHPRAPSVYMATIGFFVGYGAALQTLYKEEIDAKVMSRSSLMTTAIISFLLLVTTIVFRVSFGCESIFGAVAGAAFGILLGYLGAIALGYATDRRATNLWGIPLLRDRINAGSALYICPATD